MTPWGSTNSHVTTRISAPTMAQSSDAPKSKRSSV